MQRSELSANMEKAKEAASEVKLKADSLQVCQLHECRL